MSIWSVDPKDRSVHTLWCHDGWHENCPGFVDRPSVKCQCSCHEVAQGINPYDLPNRLRYVNSIPASWSDDGRWEVRSAKVATSVTKRRMARRRDRNGRLFLSGGTYPVLVPSMERLWDSPEWEVFNTGRTVCFVPKDLFPTPDHALLYALATKGWRVLP